MRILVADDEETLRIVISQVLVAAGHEVVTAASGEEALELFRKDPFPMVVTDIVMRKMSGIQLLVHIKELAPESLVVVITSHASLETAMRALKAGAYDFLIKPFEDIDMISAVVDRAADKLRLAAENRRYVEQLKAKTEELERLNASLRDIADRDGLTGLYNHRYFREVLDRETARSARHGHPFSVIMLDVDGFKQFNDSFGHLAGDAALRTVAHVLKNCSRASSIAARYGGEEFVVLVPEVDKVAAILVAQRICTEIRNSITLDPRTGAARRFTVSLGVATFPGDGGDANALLESADRALYAAKRAGRDRAFAAGVEPAEAPASAESVLIDAPPHVG